uniref:Uncharacterized protein n=1 Tax=Rhodnius prolixus TaxID=13249 RepID=T1HJE0_RHOPR
MEKENLTESSKGQRRKEIGGGPGLNGEISCNSSAMNNIKKDIKDFGDLLFDIMPKQLELKKDKTKKTKPPPPPDLKRKWHKDCRVKHFNRKIPKPEDKLIFFSCMRDYYENRENPPVYSFLPNFAVKVAKLLYHEKLRTLPLLEHPEMVSDLLNYEKLLHKMEKLQNILWKKFISKMNEDNNQAEMKAKNWFRQKLRRFYEKLVPYTEITDVGGWLASDHS